MLKNVKWLEAEHSCPPDGHPVYIMVDSKSSYDKRRPLNQCDIGIGVYYDINQTWYRLGCLDGADGTVQCMTSGARVIKWSYIGNEGW